MEHRIDGRPAPGRIGGLRSTRIVDDALEFLGVRQPPVGVAQELRLVLHLAPGQRVLPVHTLPAVGLGPHQACGAVADRRVAIDEVEEPRVQVWLRVGGAISPRSSEHRACPVPTMIYGRCVASADRLPSVPAPWAIAPVDARRIAAQTDGSSCQDGVAWGRGSPHDTRSNTRRASSCRRAAYRLGPERLSANSQRPAA